MNASGPVNECNSTGQPTAPAPEMLAPLEYVPCPLCGSAHFRPRHRAANYAIVDCRRCGFTYVNPQPTDADLASFYKSVFHTRAWYDRFPHLRGFDYFGNAASDAGKQSYVNLVRQQVQGGAWLDVGCGHGRLAALAAAAGYEAFGVDPSPLAVEAARQRLGPDRVYTGSVETGGFPGGRFAIVSLIGTIEHLKRPRQELREIFRIIEPDGLIVIQTPNLASLQSRHQGAGWEQFTPPGHLTYFTPQTLHRMLKEVGFRRVRFDMRFPLEAGWDHGNATGRQERHPLGLLLARLVSLMGSRCERAIQRLKGRLIGNHDIVCHARKPRTPPGVQP